MKEQRKPLTLRMKPDTYYIWCGGSCNYASKRRESAGAYIMEKDGKQVETYVVSDTDTTEFRMILTVMIHAMNTLPEGSDIVFLTNVSYIQNFDIAPTEKTANADLILECIAAEQRHHEVKVKIVSYHKYPQLPMTHEKAHEAMKNILSAKKILVICTGNSCRSQMAHGFLQSFDDTIKVCSAGTQPAAQINPLAEKVMKEVGIDISSHTPQSIDKYINQSWDYVITVCGGANESCPSFTGKVKHRLHIGFDDPSTINGSDDYVLSEFRRVRDEIKNRFWELYQNEIKLNS